MILRCLRGLRKGVVMTEANFSELHSLVTAAALVVVYGLGFVAGWLE